MLIRNYGLFWKEGDVFWSSQGKGAGTLYGVPSHHITAEPTDFREQAGVYVLYANYSMVYVGQAGNGNAKLFDRLKDHRTDSLSGRWNQFSWFGTRRVNKSGELSAEAEGAHTTHSKVLDHIEAVLIYAAEPKHNRQAGRFGEDVVQYIQYRDERIEPNLNEMIHDIWKNSKEFSS